MLRANFTQRWPRRISTGIYHFRQRDQHIVIRKHGERLADWWLRAANRDSLLDLARRVWHYGTLAQTLEYASSAGVHCAWDVLRQLRPNNPTFYYAVRRPLRQEP